jgi:peptidyl-prolyl cis-trans isomerase C
MRDKYLELLNKAKQDSKVAISDPALSKAYEDAQKQQDAAPADDAVSPDAQPQQ